MFVVFYSYWRNIKRESLAYLPWIEIKTNRKKIEKKMFYKLKMRRNLIHIEMRLFSQLVLCSKKAILVSIFLKKLKKKNSHV